MPSNYTPNYQLSQWEPEDRVLRTDFNEDNAKIDAGLALSRENLFTLAYYIGHHGLVNQINGGFRDFQFPILTYAFHPEEPVTLEGGVTVANYQATLTGKGSTGSITIKRTPYSCFRVKSASARLWIHFDGGTVKPYLNGTEMKQIDSAYVQLTSGPQGWCYAYALDTPFIESLQLKLDLTCTSDTMTVSDVILAQL